MKKTAVNLKSIAPSSICDYLKAYPGILLLDVRTKEKFVGERNPDYGTLKGAVNIPIQQMENRLTELSAYKYREILCIARIVKLSPRAAYMLLQNGLTRVTNMSGGMSVMKDNSCEK